MISSPFAHVSPDRILASNDLAVAIFDLYPVSPGHALVITKREIAIWWDATPEEKIAIIEMIDAVKIILDSKYQPSGYNIGFNAGAAAGQTVPHLHVHVIPRYSGDVPDPRGGIRHVIPAKAKYWGDNE